MTESPTRRRPPQLTADSRITRFIVDKAHYAPTKGRVKYGAFLPPGNHRLSVYLSNDLDEETIWDIGDRFVASARNRPLRARADLTKDTIDSANRSQLSIEWAPHPHHLHHNIVGWPDSKDERIALAQDLANSASLYLAPSKVP